MFPYIISYKFSNIRRDVGSISNLGGAWHFEGSFLLKKNGSFSKNEKGISLFIAKSLGDVLPVPSGSYISFFFGLWIHKNEVFLTALPVMTTNHTHALTKGKPTRVICSVKSRPASQIKWSVDPCVVGTQSQYARASGYYFITTGIFYIANPVYAMDGKNITCTVIPVYGSVIQEKITLKFSSK